AMLHKHKFPLPLPERGKKVQQRAIKGSMSGWERRGRVAGRRQPEWQRADEESLPFARLVDRSHFVVQASSPAVFGAGQRPAPQELIKLFLCGSQGNPAALYERPPELCHRQTRNRAIKATGITGQCTWVMVHRVAVRKGNT